MQTPGDTDNAEVGAARARRQAQVAMADLSTASTRDSDAYMALTDARGNLRRSNPNQDARVASLIQQRIAQLQASANQGTAAWNNPNAISGSNPQDLSDRFAGQSHRAQFAHVSATGPTGPATTTRTRADQSHRAQFAQASAPVPTGSATIRRTRTGPRPVAIYGNRPVAPPATRSTRARAGSPTAHGTIRDVGGQRQAVPLPNRHRHPQPARYGSFDGPVPTAPRMAHAQPVRHVPQLPQAPRPAYSLAPSLTPSMSVSAAPRTPLPGLPTSQVPQDSDWPAPLNINRAPRQAIPHPDSGSRSPSAAELNQRKIDRITDAIGTHRLITLMIQAYEDGPEITCSKVHVRFCAVKASEPNIPVKNRGQQWVDIFHALRKDLVYRAIEIAYNTPEDAEKQLNIVSEKYYEFEELVQDVHEARTVVEMSAQFKEVVQDIWISAGREDVLERVIDKEAALAAEEERESDPQTPSSGNEADMTIKVETTIQQVIERFDSQATVAQDFGVSNTISGPLTRARETGNSTPAVGVVHVSDGDNESHLARNDGEPFTVTFEAGQHPNSGGEILVKYSHALESVSEVFDNALQAGYMSQEESPDDSDEEL